MTRAKVRAPTPRVTEQPSKRQWEVNERVDPRDKVVNEYTTFSELRGFLLHKEAALHVIEFSTSNCVVCRKMEPVYHGASRDVQT